MQLLYASCMEQAMVDGTLRRAKTLLSTEAGSASTKVEQRWHKLVQQLSMFRRTVRTPKDEVYQLGKLAFSGKGGGNKDDLVLALQMAMYWGSEVRRDPRFREDARLAGLSLN